MQQLPVGSPPIQPLPVGNYGGHGGQWRPYATVKPGVIPLRPLGLGEILDGAFATMRARPVLMLGVAAVVVTITQLIVLAATYPFLDDLNRAVAQPNMPPEEALDIALTSLAVSGIALVFAVISRVFLSGFITLVVGTAVLGQKMEFAQVWERVRPRILPLLGLTLIYPAIAFGAAFVIGFLAVVAFPLAILFGLGAVVVGIWLVIVFSLATPALMLENAGVGRAFGRSRHLVRGSWWRIFGITLLSWVLATVIALIISLPFELFGGGFQNLDDPTPSGTYLLLSTIGAIIASTITEPFIAAVTVLLYTDQRMRSEGLDIVLARSAGAAPPQTW